jgi:predicted metal-dependent phosphoesterase TrpH
MAGQIVDLHTHSLASDGSDAPAALVRKAAARGLAAIALTDHDTMAGLGEAEDDAARVGIEFIRGIELAVQDEFGELHLLGLFMPQLSERMRSAIDTLQRNRFSRNQAMLEALARMGMPMTMDEVREHSGKEAIGRPHIALAMQSKGYVSSRKEAFERYIGWNKSAFIPRSLFSPEEGIRLLRDQGATVALAHPYLSRKMAAGRLDGILAEFRQYGLRAIEAYHSSHDPEQVRLCVKLAEKHDLLLTGGSDYHGSNKDGIALGMASRRLRVPYFLLEKLREYRKSKGLPV